LNARKFGGSYDPAVHSFAPLLAVGFLALVPPAVPVAQTATHPPIAEGTASLHKPDGSVDVTYRYRLVEPPASAIVDGKRVPLVVFLHGAGERGDDNSAQLTHFVGAAAGAEFQARAPCFILAMQCPRDESWALIDLQAFREKGVMPTFALEPTKSMRSVMQAIDEVLVARPIDHERIYLTGLSMGGFGAFDLAARRPHLFAAVIPICGGGDPATASRLIGVPFYIVHGSDDPVVPVQLSRAMRDAIKAAQPKTSTPTTPMYREYEKVGHNSWTPAYRFGPDGVLDWMFNQRRIASKPQPNPTPDRTPDPKSNPPPAQDPAARQPTRGAIDAANAARRDRIG